VGIDLNPEYLKLIEARTERPLGEEQERSLMDLFDEMSDD
jgi:hypothetical protein